MNLYGFVGNDGVNKWDYLGLRGETHTHDLPAFPLEGTECNLPSVSLVKLDIRGSFDKESYTSSSQQSNPVTVWVIYEFSNDYYIGPQWQWETCYRHAEHQPHPDPYGAGEIPWGQNISPLKFNAARQQDVQLYFYYLSCECEINESTFEYSGRKTWVIKSASASLFVGAKENTWGDYEWYFQFPKLPPR